MSNSSKLDDFKYQCECNLSYVSPSDKVVVEIGQGHLIDQFSNLLAENAALQKRNDELSDMVRELDHGHML